MIKWIILAVLILCLPIVYCVDSGIPVYKQGDVANIKVPCINNQTYCSGSAACNITILNSLDLIMVNNEAMTNGGSYFNYSFNQTSVSGIYKAQVVCVDGGVNGYSLFNFDITSSGFPENLNVAPIMFTVIFIIALFMVIGFLVSHEHPALGMPLIFFAFGLIILLVNLCRISLYADSSGIQDQLNQSYFIIMVMVGLAIAYSFVYLLIFGTKWLMESIKEKKLKNMGMGKEDDL
jgi:hypothetical protein